MAKHGEDGWKHYALYRNTNEWLLMTIDPCWDLPFGCYKAVRVKRTEGKRVPLPWNTIKCGMLIRRAASSSEVSMVIATLPNHIKTIEYTFEHKAFFMFEYSIDGSEWKPLWTEESGEERIVETISEGDV